MSPELPTVQLAKLIATELAKEDLLAVEVAAFAERLAAGAISSEGWKEFIKVSLPKVGPT